MTSLGYVVAHDTWTNQQAFADEDEDEDDGGGEGGDDEGGGGGEGGEDGEDGEEGEDEDAKDQPPVTAGGLFTLKTYPVREISRPLSMTEKILQLRLSAGTDISAKGAFESFGLSGEFVYGMKDNFALLGGLTNAYNFKQFGVYFGFEAALAYDLLNFRLAANVSRTALAEYCGAASSPPSDCTNPTTGEFQAELPTGSYSAGGTKFSLDIGFPFRYSIRPEIAIVALHTLMSIDFNSIDDGYTIIEPDPNGMDGALRARNVRNGGKPDLKPSLGIATNPVPPLSVVIFAQLKIPDFDTSAGAFQVPVTGRVQFSPNQKFDIGMEFTLLNVKPPAGQSPIDNRFLALFFQTRVGR